MSNVDKHYEALSSQAKEVYNFLISQGKSNECIKPLMYRQVERDKLHITKETAMSIYRYAVHRLKICRKPVSNRKGKKAMSHLIETTNITEPAGPIDLLAIANAPNVNNICTVKGSAHHVESIDTTIGTHYNIEERFKKIEAKLDELLAIFKL